MFIPLETCSVFADYVISFFDYRNPSQDFVIFFFPEELFLIPLGICLLLEWASSFFLCYHLILKSTDNVLLFVSRYSAES